jgi:hypothetical protein
VVVRLPTTVCSVAVSVGRSLLLGDEFNSSLNGKNEFARLPVVDGISRSAHARSHITLTPVLNATTATSPPSIAPRPPPAEDRSARHATATGGPQDVRCQPAGPPTPPLQAVETVADARVSSCWVRLSAGRAPSRWSVAAACSSSPIVVVLGP